MLSEEKAKSIKSKLYQEYKDKPKEQRDKIVYGTLRKIGWKPKDEGDHEYR